MDATLRTSPLIRLMAQGWVESQFHLSFSPLKEGHIYHKKGYVDERCFEKEL